MRKVIFAATMLASFMANANTTVAWQSLGNSTDANGAYYIQRLTINDTKDIERLCFNQFARKMQAVTPGDTIHEIVPGYYYITSDSFKKGNAVIEIRTRGTLANVSYRPDGFHAVKTDEAVVPVEFTRASLSTTPEMWSIPGKDRMPYGDGIYRFNESLKSNESLSPFDIIPSFKSVKPTKKGYCTNAVTPEIRTIVHDNYEFYRITINQSGVVIEAASEQAEKMARMALMKLWHRNGGKIPTAVIEDYPDFHYRGFMIDIARNNQSLETLEDVAFRLSQYRMNKLHFHFSDDEAWRLEIPAFPELTQVGSRRGYTIDEKDHLVQIFAGNGNPEETTGTANGYITREQFIKFIQKCHSLGIDVIPEIESPGHARAAIKAMEARYHRTGDPLYRLIEDGDTSKYTSAQAFHDNVMNPALPGPVNFMRTVIGEIISMYNDADV
ncbi:MAG: family 20 glycosylhydrolase, partial [Muribaculaceae bacterium]|nr:family 20 glycosylhydrolase [Muribaculaceae bacterium]